MKIKLKELNPNPFKQQINGGKLNAQKIELLRESIKSDGFWDNVICRKRKDGKYEVAYGHHRLAAAKKELGDNYEVDIPVKPLTDDMMVRILANENNMQNEEYAIYQVDTVKMTKSYLERLCPATGRSKGPQKVAHARDDQGIGARQISEFLGEKNWSKSKVAEYLRLDAKLDPTIIEEMKNAANTGKKDNGITVTHAELIARIPDHKKQREVADIVKKRDLSKRDTESVVRDVLGKGAQKLPKDGDFKLEFPILKRMMKNYEAAEHVFETHSVAEWMMKRRFVDFSDKDQAIIKRVLDEFDNARRTFMKGEGSLCVKSLS